MRTSGVGASGWMVGVVAATVAAGSGACREPVTSGTRMPCDAEIQYQATRFAAGLEVLKIGGGKTEVETKSIREASEKLQAYVAVQRRACDEYNNGVITRERYDEKASEATNFLFGMASERAKSSNVREKASGEYVVAAIKAKSEIVSPLSLKVTLRARTPLPSGEYAPEIVVPPNYPLATGTLGAFEVAARETVYLYMFQVTPQKEVNVLFPNKALQTQNPLEGGQPVRMPGMGADGKAKTFKLDDRNIGLERVYFVVSAKPIAALDRSLAAFAEGRATAIESDPSLADFASLKAGSEGLCAGQKTRDLTIVDDPDAGKAKSARASDECVRTRGWVIDDAPEPGKPVAHSLAAFTAPGERVIVKFFPFQHVPAAEAASRVDAFNAPTPDGAKQRGISIEN